MTHVRPKKSPVDPRGLRDLMLDLDKSQVELGELIGSTSHASEFMSGKRTVPLSVRVAMFRQWGASADKLLELPLR